MENLSRYLAEQNGSDMFYSDSRPFVGYAMVEEAALESFAPGFPVHPSGSFIRRSVDFTAGYEGYSPANEMAKAAGQEMGCAAPSTSVYDVRDYPWHVAAAVLITNRKGSGTQTVPIRLDRSRHPSKEDAEYAIRSFHRDAIELVSQFTSPEFAVHPIGKYPRPNSDGLFFHFGIAIVKAVIR